MKKLQFKIQKFKREQAKETSRLIISCFNKFVAPSFSPKGRKQWVSEISPEKLIKRSKLKEREIYVAIQDNQVIGIIEGVKNHRIVLLFVKEKFQQKGVAKRLVNKIESIFKRRRTKVMKIFSSTYAIKFYEKMGYKKSRGLIEKEAKVFQPMRKVL